MNCNASRDADLIHSASQTVRDFYRGFELKPALMSLPGSDFQFFFEGPDGLIWGKVFCRRVHREDFNKLDGQIRYWIQAMGEEVTLYLFFPFQDCAEILPEWGDEVHCFQYDQVGWEKKGQWLFHPWNEEPKKQEGETRPTRHVSRASSAYPFFRQAQLSCEELKELVEIASDLKRPLMSRY